MSANSSGTWSVGKTSLIASIASTSLVMLWAGDCWMKQSKSDVENSGNAACDDGYMTS